MIDEHGAPGTSRCGALPLAWQRSGACLATYADRFISRFDILTDLAAALAGRRLAAELAD
jgi:hypothetical protein